MTIVDIAKESGYSVSTVSRVLNGRRDVSPAARKKIMEIVDAHQFVPNNNAKHLKQSVSKSILILAKGTSNMLFPISSRPFRQRWKNRTIPFASITWTRKRTKSLRLSECAVSINPWESYSSEAMQSILRNSLRRCMFHVCW